MQVQCTVEVKTIKLSTAIYVIAPLFRFTIRTYAHFNDKTKGVKAASRVRSWVKNKGCEIDDR